MPITLIIGILIVLAVLYGYEVLRKRGSKSMNEPSHSIEELESKVWLRGDTDSYVQLETAYLDAPPHDFLFWALYMANKYDYSAAYEDVYLSIAQDYYPIDSALFKMDDKTRTFALTYLKLAAKKNDATALETLKEMKEKHFPTDWWEIDSTK